MLFWQFEPDAGTPVGGTWAGTTPRFAGALLRHVYIEFTTATTTFDFALTDEEGRHFIHLTGNTGCLNREYQIPLIGRYTLSITNASVNEAFDIRIVAQDGP
jgi:hypothetical protein